MPSSKIFLYSSILFLFGVFLKSIGFAGAIIYVSLAFSFLLAGFLIYKKEYSLFLAVLLPFFILLGAFYYQLDHSQLEKTFIESGDISERGVVVSNPTLEEGVQEFHLKLENEDSSTVLVKTRKYPEIEYGDELYIEGSVESLEGDSSYDKFLYKNNVVGLIYFPKELEVLDVNKASKIKEFLYDLRNRSALVFQRVLSPLKAAFINGLTLGGYSGFSEQFRDAMEKSGTTHLVALSGYNISVLVWVCMAFFSYFFRKRSSIFITLFIIFCFVVMTGAEASVIRAAIMGSLIVIAGYFGRIYDLRNSLVLAGLLMVLFNPKVLAFDVGFQLSFMALLGIVYVKPLLDKFFGFETQGFMAWKENLTVTTSAQMAVFPLLMIRFDYFSLSSLPANVAILELIPITMALGFLILFLYSVLEPVALILSWIAGIFLSVEIEIIELFSDLAIPVNFEMNWITVTVYYLILFGGTYLINRKLNYV